MSRQTSHWLRGYGRATLGSDVSAGLTTAVMLIPQAMAYALLAGLPPIMGLYASTVPLVVYALIGTSRQLSIGPMAMASLVLAGGIQEILGEDAADPVKVTAIAITITLGAGLCQLGLAALRLGGMVNLLSHPVVTGFTSAAAIVIGTSQLQHVLGFTVPRGLSAVQTLDYLGSHLDQVQAISITVGLLAIALLAGLQRFVPRAPAALTVVVLGIVVSWILGLEARGVAVLGFVPPGLPRPRWIDVDLQLARDAAPMALTVALVGFMESISAARIYARQNRYALSPGRELVALGSANLAAGVFGGYTVGGALSRTAVNAQAGAQTPVANIVTALAMGLTLAVLTPVFHPLPTPILAAIILVAVVGLVDLGEIVHLWRVKRDDLALLGITFGTTLFWSIEGGILVGVVASLLWLVYTSTRPAIRSLGRIPGTRSYRCIDHFQEAETFPRVLILRMDAQFFFGNIAYLKENLYQRIDEGDDTVAVVLDASSMNSLDSTAADALNHLILDLRAQRIEVYISHAKEAVLSLMHVTGITHTLGEGHIYYEVENAVQAAIAHRDAVERGLACEEEQFGEDDLLD